MKNFTFKTFAVACGMLMCSANADAQMVISKVFYSGTKNISDGKNYTKNPEYIELHNNTDKEYDIAGMYIALVENESSTGAYLVKDQTNNDVKLKQVFQLPETEHKVPAWGTVVLAASAVDHADAAGVPDLSKADYEFGGLAVDNPDVPNLTLKYTYVATLPYLNLANGGDAGVLLITKKNGDSYLKFNDETAYVFANGKDKGNKYLNFNAYYAMDAVEIIKAKKNTSTGKYEIDPERKRICTSKDAGYVPVPEDVSMLRDGYIAYRKTAINKDGNIYLYDTGNSCNDFMVATGLASSAYNEQPDDVTEVVITIPETGFFPFMPEKYFFTENGLHVTYLSAVAADKNLKYLDYEGDAKVFNNSAFMIIGTPGEHKVYYTKADRNMAAAGCDAWLAAGDEKCVDGVLTITTKNRYPMKFVNEKGNVRFEREIVDGNYQKIKMNPAAGENFYITLNYLDETVNTMPWAGYMPDVTGISEINTTSVDNKAVYNINGMKMNASNLPAGIYIKAGRAFIVK